jgi:hypothetical protein
MLEMPIPGSGHGPGRQDKEFGLIPHRSARARSIGYLVANW